MRKLLIATLLLLPMAAMAQSLTVVVKDTPASSIMLPRAGAMFIPGTHTAVLTWSWTQGSGPAAASFKVYKGTTPGGENYSAPLATVPSNQVTYTDTAFTATAYYTVTAVGTPPNGESVPSNEAQGVFPSAPASPSLQPISVQ